MSGLFVVLQGRPVAEHRGAEGARDDLSGMCRANVPVEAGLPRELGVALVALKGLFRRVGLHVSGQSLLVFECGPAFPAWKGRSGGRV